MGYPINSLESQQNSKNLRDFLDQRDKELTELVAERKRRIIPCEAELEEIQRAKNALRIDQGPILHAQTNSLRKYLSSREQQLRKTVDEVAGDLGDIMNELAEIRKVKSEIGLSPAKEMSVNDSCETPLAEWANVPDSVGIPYQSMTIGQLALLALKDHFRSGASIAQIVAFFRDKWGREIDRPSLSPQLSRLYKRDEVGRIPSLPGWFYIAPGASLGGRNPYRHRHSGEINWKLPSQADEQDELLWTRATQPGVSDES